MKIGKGPTRVSYYLLDSTVSLPLGLVFFGGLGGGQEFPLNAAESIL
jgi:hypothetical protein